MSSKRRSPQSLVLAHTEIGRGSLNVDKTVIVIGEVNTDIILSHLPHLPHAEQDVIAGEFDVVVGGQAGTIARALSSLGLRVRFVGRVGDDDYGALAIRQLRKDGVDVEALTIDPTVPTGVTVVLSTGRERAFATFLGSMTTIEPDDVRQALRLPADHMHVSSYYLRTKLRSELPDIFDEAHALGITTSIDPGWDPFNRWDPDILDVLTRTDVFLPNEIEALTITGASTPAEALAILDERVGTSIIKTGGQGCLLRYDSKVIVCPPFPVEVVDVTSAGDVFNAGFLYGFLAGWPLWDAARFANACGAIAVMRVGSSGMVTGIEEVDSFLAARGISLLKEGV
jgi:sugar/nucleoside kinase (ribokinase family)